MNVIPTRLAEVLIVEPKVFGDDRGFFLETYQQQRYAEAGISCSFVQDNISFSQRHTLRGLHFQHPQGQAKLVQVLEGEIYDVAVDVRRGSPTFGQWAGVMLSSETRRQLFIPAGFAHGFCVTSATALFMYKCSDYYAPDQESGLCWDDPDLKIEWPVAQPLLSARDQALPYLSRIAPERLPRYEV
ncbi:MAG: dTDP-4-dehydrorhamnose 3,5-epimerase [Desulfatitalea sp.]|nr:dTDP-4-dehydrorhamnose 3,5-epimerase [Desulfatitalea sp.]NNK00122.1 dTDP-4-dehydrorhamnose 3,5-epimerase [Desulfatitalea sp.]